MLITASCCTDILWLLRFLFVLGIENKIFLKYENDFCVWILKSLRHLKSVARAVGTSQLWLNA